MNLMKSEKKNFRKKFETWNWIFEMKLKSGNWFEKWISRMNLRNNFEKWIEMNLKNENWFEKKKNNMEIEID